MNISKDSGKIRGSRGQQHIYKFLKHTPGRLQPKWQNCMPGSRQSHTWGGSRMQGIQSTKWGDTGDSEAAFFTISHPIPYILQISEPVSGLNWMRGKTHWTGNDWCFNLEQILVSENKTISTCKCLNSNRIWLRFHIRVSSKNSGWENN